MRIPHFVVCAVAPATLLLGINTAHAQEYPTKPIRIITAEPGGGHDFTARVIAPGLSRSLGQQVIVDNRPGAAIAGDVGAKSAPDGYTLLLYGSSLWLLPFMRNNVLYDPVKDFAPIGLETTAPNLIVVHPSLPVKTVKELIALAKGKPGALNYGTGATGASTHLASELFKIMAGVDMLRIPYKGNGPAINALIGGQVQLMFPTAGSVTTHLKSGRLRAIAVTSARPSALFPGVPTVAASVPGYESDSIIGLFAPAKLPPALISRLSQEAARVVNQPEVKEKFAASGVESVGSTPQEFAAAIKSEMTRYGKVIKDAGIRED